MTANGDEVKDFMEHEKQLEIAKEMAGMKPHQEPKLVVQPGHMSDWQEQKDKALKFFNSKCLPPSLKTPEQVLVIMQCGQELGLQPMESIRGLNLIEGKIAMSGELMLALFLKNTKGAKIKWLTPKEKTHLECELELSRDGQEPMRIRFDMEDAKRAGLAGRAGWQKYPAAYLRARVASAGIRAYAPDAFFKCYLDEELGGEPIEGEVTNE